MEVKTVAKCLLISGGIFLTLKYGRNITKILRLNKQGKASYLSKIFGIFHWSPLSKLSMKAINVQLASTEQKCEELLGYLKSLVEHDGFLGFDCEWVTGKPVALVQLSSKDGFCVIVQLSKMSSFPPALKNILEDYTILKVGVGTQNDAKLLLRDYQVNTRGCLDLRFLAPLKIKMGLAALASDHLNISLDKSSRIRRSNWAADILSEEQLWYAAQDAYIGALLFSKLIASKLSEVPKESEDLPNMWAVVAPYTDTTFKGTHSVQQKDSSSALGKGDKMRDENVCINYCKSKSWRAYTPRQKPMYSNCKMLAPDGEVLCTCSKTKANWYIKQGLAREVCVDPYQIQLLFEPAKRFRNASGLYYVQDKVNQCVVCGKKDSHLRKNVVPHEYRRHFPDAMKKHQSHDVLPLCQPCHIQSNFADIALRQELAAKCNASIGVGNDVKTVDDMRLKKLRSAARALQNGGYRISESRREELRNIVLEELPYYEDLLEKKLPDRESGDSPKLRDKPLETVLPLLHDIEISIANENYIPHGLKVTEHFAKEGIPGLMKLERIWRKHFIEAMKPSFLPELWSVSHDLFSLEDSQQHKRVIDGDEVFKSKMEKVKVIEKS